MQHFHGIYLITPFTRYDMTVALTEYINEKVGVNEEAKVIQANGVKI